MQSYMLYSQAMSKSDWFLYIIETACGKLYTGITTDVNRRFKQHERGTGAKYLRGKDPLTLRLTVACENRSTATQLELKVKKLPRSEKLALIGSPHEVYQLL